MVSPPPVSWATAASSSAACRAHASTTASRTRSCRERRDWSRRSAPDTSAPVLLCVVHARDGLELRGLLLGSGVVQEVAAADLRAGEILEEARLAQGGMNLDVE